MVPPLWLTDELTANPINYKTVMASVPVSREMLEDTATITFPSFGQYLIRDTVRRIMLRPGTRCPSRGSLVGSNASSNTSTRPRRSLASRGRDGGC